MNKKPKEEENSPARRISVYEGQTTPAVRGEVAGVSTPTIGLAPAGPTAPTAMYRAPHWDVDPITRRIQSRASFEDNTRYEWNEGGDEKESGTDAMGTGFKGNGQSGFFGTIPHIVPNVRRFVYFVVCGGD